jgi:hypothetical protein
MKMKRSTGIIDKRTAYGGREAKGLAVFSPK